MSGRVYSLLVPRVDQSGPTTVAVDLANSAVRRGWSCNLLYLSGEPTRTDILPNVRVRQLRLRDFWMLEGVLHSHGLRPDLVASLFALRGRRQILCTLHGHFPHHLYFDHGVWRSRFAWAIWRRAIGMLDARICISRTMQRYYRLTSPMLETTLLINHRAEGPVGVGANDPLVDRWFERQREIGRTILVYVGSLISRKNVLELSRAVAKSPGLALLICGAGPLAGELAGIAKPMGTILLAGAVARPGDLLGRADMLVLPSHAEGLPLVVLEAASRGIPSLLSNIAVHRELAGYGIGTVFDHRNFSDFTQKAESLKSLGRDGATRLSAIWAANFHPDRAMADHERLLEALSTGARKDRCHDRI